MIKTCFELPFPVLFKHFFVVAIKFDTIFNLPTSSPFSNKYLSANFAIVKSITVNTKFTVKVHFSNDAFELIHLLYKHQVDISALATLPLSFDSEDAGVETKNNTCITTAF